jgi:hypothetical protein
LVEQRTENPRVTGSIPVPATSFNTGGVAAKSAVKLRVNGLVIAFVGAIFFLAKEGRFARLICADDFL